MSGFGIGICVDLTVGFADGFEEACVLGEGSLISVIGLGVGEIVG